MDLIICKSQTPFQSSARCGALKGCRVVPPTCRPRAAYVRPVAGFPGQSVHAAIPGKEPATGPDVGATWREGEYSRKIPNISVWYAVWYITFSPEPNVVLNSIHARKNSPIPEGSVQNDRSCQIVPNKTRLCQTESVKSPLQSGWVHFGCSPVLSGVITIHLLSEAKTIIIA